MTTLTIVMTIVSLATYWLVGFSRRSAASNERKYFVAGQTVSAEDYANVSVGYALQMAALFLFAYWGFIYGLGALWTAVFWALGYVVLYAVLPQFREYRNTGGGDTLHSFIKKRFSSSRNLQRLAASATLIGLLGVLFAEVDYTVAVYHPISAVAPIAWQAVFLVLGVGYVVWNGYQAEVNTERIQVPVAYVGLITVLLATLPSVYLHAGKKAYWMTAGLLALAFATMAIAKTVDITARRHGKWLRWLDWQAAIPLAALVVVVGESAWVLRYMTPGTASSVLDLPFGTQLLAQGIVGLVSLLLANALWMPVDISTWQRVSSVSGTDAEALVALRRGTFRVLLESPASWCLGAALGWIISAGGYVPADFADPYNVAAAFADRLFAGQFASFWGPLQSPLYVVYVVACVAVMVSTITSILSAVSFTADRDLFPDSQDNVGRVRLLSLLILVGGFLMYQGLRNVFGANLPTVLYGAYSAQLSLFVVTILALYRRRLSASSAVWSIVVGLVLAFASTIAAMLYPNRPELAISQPLFAVAGSIAGYIVAYQLVENRHQA